MIHQPTGGTQGTAADIEIQAREILFLRTKMNQLMALHTGQSLETVERDVDRDRYMSAEEAKAYQPKGATGVAVRTLVELALDAPSWSAPAR